MRIQKLLALTACLVSVFLVGEARAQPHAEVFNANDAHIAIRRLALRLRVLSDVEKHRSSDWIWNEDSRSSLSSSEAKADVVVDTHTWSSLYANKSVWTDLPPVMQEDLRLLATANSGRSEHLQIWIDSGFNDAKARQDAILYHELRDTCRKALLEGSLFYLSVPGNYGRLPARSFHVEAKCLRSLAEDLQFAVDAKVHDIQLGMQFRDADRIGSAMLEHVFLVQHIPLDHCSSELRDAVTQYELAVLKLSAEVRGLEMRTQEHEVEGPLSIDSSVRGYDEYVEAMEELHRQLHMGGELVSLRRIMLARTPDWLKKGTLVRSSAVAGSEQ